MGMPSVLPSAILWLSLLLPSLLCENLLCLYSPLLPNGRTFKPIVTECPPNHLCFKLEGRYGNYSALTARGCMVKEECSKEGTLRFRGVVYTTTYKCCSTRYCNTGVGVLADAFTIAAALVTAAALANSW